MTYYFEFSDYLDLTFLVDKFANGRSWEETAQDIIFSTMEFATKFATACDDFQLALCAKIKIGQHLYGPAPSQPTTAVGDRPATNDDGD